MKNRLVESMTKLKHGGYAVRVWKSHKDEDEAMRFNGTELEDVLRLGLADHSMAGVAKALAEVEGVDAVEVVDLYGDGILIYPDWK